MWFCKITVDQNSNNSKSVSLHGFIYRPEQKLFEELGKFRLEGMVSKQRVMVLGKAFRYLSVFCCLPYGQWDTQMTVPRWNMTVSVVPQDLVLFTIHIQKLSCRIKAGVRRGRMQAREFMGFSSWCKTHEAEHIQTRVLRSIPFFFFFKLFL